MTEHGTGRDRGMVLLGWISAGLSLLVGIGAVLLLLVPTRPGAAAADVTLIQAVADAGFVVVSPLTGLLIVRAQPRNVIGWLFIAFSGLIVTGFFGDGLARHLEPSAAVSWAVWATTVFSNGGFAAFALLLLYFPTGRLISARWRWLPALVVLGAVALLIDQAFTPVVIGDVPQIHSPIAQPTWSGALEIISAAGSVLVAGAVLGAMAQMVVRIRRSRGVERQQLKWFVLSAAIVGSLLVLAAITQPLGWISDVFWAAAFTAFPILPVATGIAILRHRLFDIDLIIKRTVAYAALSLVLLAVYGAGVLLLQLVLEPFTRQAELAVAGSTLAVAAVFGPARRRIQRAVDRRFDRARYDAARTVAEFSNRLRDGLDLQAIGDEMLGTVIETMHPSTASVWLREVVRS